MEGNKISGGNRQKPNSKTRCGKPERVCDYSKNNDPVRLLAVTGSGSTGQS
jgi:hypothetical protein